MSAAGGILQRFRPVGTPGMAAVAGVPVDRAAESAAELQPVLALLDDAQDECARVRAEADRRAAQIRAAAKVRASATVEAARRQAEAERAAAAGRMQQALDADVAAALVEAQAAAGQVRAVAARMLPGLVEQLIANVRSVAARGPAQGGSVAERGRVGVR